ncbi:MAG: hypothetical protein ABFS35_16735 [Bacteroidota bacterium]
MKISIQKPFTGILAFLLILFTMPLGHALMIITEHVFGESWVFPAAFILGLIGLVMLIMGMKTKNETKATFWGLFAGLLIWTGWIEFSFVYFANHVGVQPLIENGEVVTKPEYLILPSSIGFMTVMFIYFLFNRHTQCHFFRWFQRNLKMKFIKRKPIEKDRLFALITAIEIITIMWTFYIVLLLIYDKEILGDYHPVTYAFAFASLLWSLYLFINLLKINKMAYAIRYGIPVVIIFWNVVEILGRWNFFNEIWVEPLKYKVEILSILAVFILLGGILFYENKYKVKENTASSVE